TTIASVCACAPCAYIVDDRPLDDDGPWPVGLRDEPFRRREAGGVGITASGGRCAARDADAWAAGSGRWASAHRPAPAADAPLQGNARRRPGAAGSSTNGHVRHGRTVD